MINKVDSRPSFSDDCVTACTVVKTAEEWPVPPTQCDGLYSSYASRKMACSPQPSVFDDSVTACVVVKTAEEWSLLLLVVSPSGELIGGGGSRSRLRIECSEGGLRPLIFRATFCCLSESVKEDCGL